MAIVEPLSSLSEAGRRRLAIKSPVTLKRIGEIEVQTAGDVADAVRRGREAQPAWAALTVAERAHVLLIRGPTHEW